jgi:hypothetical protein
MKRCLGQGEKKVWGKPGSGGDACTIPFQCSIAKYTACFISIHTEAYFRENFLLPVTAQGKK